MTDAGQPPSLRAASLHAEEDPWKLGSSVRDLFGAGLVLSLMLAISGVLAGLVTSYSCETGPPNLVQTVSAQYQTGYCKLTHFPGVPNTLASWLVVMGVFLGPSALALAAGVAGAVTGGRIVFRVLSVAAVLLAVLAWVLVTQAGIANFPGAG
jgi:hypothetical protein